MRLQNDSLIANPVDMSAPWESPKIPVYYAATYSVQLAWTGAPMGILKLQCSNSPKNAHDAEVIWTDIENSEQMVTEDGNHTWNVRMTGYIWSRAVWTPVSGSGEITVARFAAKGG